MRKLMKSSAAALMLTCMAGNVWAATEAGCARPEELSAVKVAAIQQRLMVAALSCNAAPLYNNFVTTYQKDLQASDRNLESFFRRLHGKTGTEDYHAFKTHLANASSMQSIRDITGYCSSAKEMFDVALDPGRSTLTVFAASQKTMADDAFSPCQFQTAGVVHSATPPAHVPVPRSKPADRVVPAQGKGLTAPN
jgi:hypothetical protein